RPADAPRAASDPVDLSGRAPLLAGRGPVARSSRGASGNRRGAPLPARRAARGHDAAAPSEAIDRRPDRGPAPETLQRRARLPGDLEERPFGLALGGSPPRRL